jgi:hypothetical protein
MGDTYNCVACFTRVFASLTQAIYAMNERYFMSDKAISQEIDEFALCPKDYLPRTTAILSSPGRTREELERSSIAIRQLWRELVQMSGSYEPRFDPA